MCVGSEMSAGNDVRWVLSVAAATDGAVPCKAPTRCRQAASQMLTASTCKTSWDSTSGRGDIGLMTHL